MAPDLLAARESSVAFGKAYISYFAGEREDYQQANQWIKKGLLEILNPRSMKYSEILQRSNGMSAINDNDGQEDCAVT